MPAPFFLNSRMRMRSFFSLQSLSELWTTVFSISRFPFPLRLPLQPHLRDRCHQAATDSSRGVSQPSSAATRTTTSRTCCPSKGGRTKWCCLFLNFSFFLFIAHFLYITYLFFPHIFSYLLRYSPPYVIYCLCILAKITNFYAEWAPAGPTVRTGRSAKTIHKN